MFSDEKIPLPIIYLLKKIRHVSDELFVTRTLNETRERQEEEACTIT